MYNQVQPSQNCVFGKAGLGYTPIHEKKVKKFSSFFSKSEPNAMSFISCNYCMKKGHVFKNCYARKYDASKGFMKWIPKGCKEAQPFWTQAIKGYHVMLCCFAINTTSYVLNRVLIRPILNKTPYALFKGRRPTLNHLKVFGCKCFILNNGKEQLGKFDSKADKGIFLGYAISSHSYRVYNKRLMIIEEFVHVVFDETNLVQQDQRPKTQGVD